MSSGVAIADDCKSIFEDIKKNKSYVSGILNCVLSDVLGTGTAFSILRKKNPSLLKLRSELF